MQLGPGQHEPQLADVKAAFDYLDLVDPDLRLPVGVTRVKVRCPWSSKYIAITIPKNDRSSARCQMVPRRPRRLLPSQSSRRRGRPTSHQSVSGSPSSRSHSIVLAVCSQAPPPVPQNDHSFWAARL